MACCITGVSCRDIATVQSGSILLFMVVILGILSWFCLRTGQHLMLNYELLHMQLQKEQELQVLDSYMYYGLRFCQLHKNDFKDLVLEKPIIVECAPADGSTTSPGVIHITGDGKYFNIKTIVQSSRNSELVGIITFHVHVMNDDTTHLVVDAWSIEPRLHVVSPGAPICSHFD